jgi:hypothetical protein
LPRSFSLDDVYISPWRSFRLPRSLP